MVVDLLSGSSKRPTLFKFSNEWNQYAFSPRISKVSWIFRSPLSQYLQVSELFADFCEFTAGSQAFVGWSGYRFGLFNFLKSLHDGSQHLLRSSEFPVQAQE